MGLKHLRKGRVLMTLSPSEQMFYVATKITAFAGGKPLSLGTGFFYFARLDTDGTRSVNLMVTNKHVLEGADAVVVTFHVADTNVPTVPSGRYFEFYIELAEVIFHPDEAVDLCAFPIGGALEQAASEGSPIFFVALSKNSMPSAEQWANFEAIERVTMVGCPNGLFDEFNKMPIARSGSTATDIKKRYQGKNEFLVDLACFHGSSGSPIFIYDPTAAFGRPLMSFVGVLYAGPIMDNEGEIHFAKGPTFRFESVMHLGLAIRSTELLAFDRWVLEADAQGLIGGISPEDVTEPPVLG